MEPQMDLVFFFNGVELTEETVLNAPAGLPIPVKGGTVCRRGRIWTVAEVQRSYASSGNPVYRIFLTSQSGVIGS
jgi:hypothetical protein